MASQKLQGLIAAPFTPMHKDGSLNLSIIPSYYNLLKENSVNGAFICGSTGEGVSMSVTEKKAVAVAWAACSEKAIKIRESKRSMVTKVRGLCEACAVVLSSIHCSVKE